MELPELPENWREILIDKCEEACGFLHITEATLGNKILGNAGFFPDLRKGGSCRVDTFRNIVRWFQDNLPKHKSYPRVTKRNAALANHAAAVK